MRIVVVIVFVVGLVLLVGELEAKHPPARNIAIPIYLGDPDDIYDARPGDRVRLEVSSDAGSDQIGSVEVQIMRMFAWFMKLDLRSKYQGITATEVAGDKRSRAVGYFSGHGD